MELIVNVTENWGIGLENRLLVSISADLRRFRQLTEGKTVILGRRTLETFPGGRPLKNRRNILLTANPDFRAEGAEIVHSEQEANPDFRAEGAEIVHSEQELFAVLRTLPREELCVIGGASVYRLLLDYCDAARVTKTGLVCKADAFFPDLDAAENWRIAAQSELQEENGLRFRYVDYVNLTPKAFPTV